MGKIIRRCIAVLLCVTATILILIPSNDAQATTTKGDFELDGSTLVSYLGSDTEVTLPNTITAIGNDAFSGNEALYKVVIPDSVKTIGPSAFENCTNLTKVSIGSSVKSIGSAAFSGCKFLQSINIPAKCDSLGSGVFAGCSSLSSVSIDSDNRSYVCADGVIYKRDGSELVQYLAGRASSTYSMPSTVSTIGEYAFWGAESLTNATVAKGIKEIPEYAFSNCASLSKVTLPSSVESLMAYSFENCPNLTSISIPDSVGYIDEKAFYLTNGAKIELTDSDGNVSESVAVSDVADAAGQESVEGSDNSSSEDQHAEADPSEPKQVDNPNAQDRPDGYTPSLSGSSNWVDIINDRDFANNKAQNELGSGMLVGGNAMFLMSQDQPVRGYDLEDAEAEDSLSESGGNTSSKNDIFDIIDGTLANYNGSDENVSIPDNVDTIGQRAFYKNENIKNVEIPSTVSKIDDFAFSRSALTDVSIPDSVVAIGYAAFYHCEDLENVNIPSSVECIELGAFDGTKWLNDWKNSDDGSSYLMVGDGILLDYKGEGGNISLPDGTKQIAPGAFDSNESITGVTVPEGVTKIGEDAFNGCSNLEKVTLPEGLLTIEDRAFGGCALAAVQIPDSVTSIGLGAFDTSSNGNTLKTVIFKGNNVPNVTYKDTSTRLSAKDLRVDALNGVENVIVQADSDLDSGTLFNPIYYGFHGQIYTVSDDSTDEMGTLSLLKTTKKPDANGTVNIDSNVKIGAEDYVMNGVKEHAFDAYLNFDEWCDVKPESVNVSGNASDDLNTLLNDITSRITGSIDNDTSIDVVLENTSFSGSASATVDGYDDGGTLVISEDEGNREAIMSGLYNYYGPNTSVTMLPLELTLYDKTGTILIHKLGDSKMDVTIPLPQQFINSDSVMVASLDDNGSLTELSTSISGESLSFVANHCSKYAIYIKNETTVVSSGQSMGPDTENESSGDDGTSSDEVSMGEAMDNNGGDLRKGRDEIDEVVEITQINNADTSEAGNISTVGFVNTLSKKVGSISVKWFIIVILFALAAILFLYKPSRAKSKSQD